MRLEDLCTVFTDGDWIESKDQSEEGIRLVQTGNIGEGIYLEKESRAKYISEETFKRMKCTEIFPGDILVSRLPDPVGRACIVPEKKERMVTAVDCTICRPNKSLISKEYLCYFMRSNAYYTRLMGNVKGATRKRISRKNLGNIELDVPSKEEQLRVVKQLDCLTKVINSRRKEIELLDDLIKARFVEMFGDFKINPMGWPVVGFEEIAIIDGNMTTDYEKYADYPHIGIDSIEKESGLLKGYRTVAEDGVISAKYVFTPAHIIYSKIRPNLNKVALPDFDGLCSADAYPILPIEGKCNRVFLAYDMRSQFFLDYILQFCNRTNLPKVNRKEVTGFRTPLPPIELQNEFASFVAQVDKSKLLEARQGGFIAKTGRQISFCR